MVKVKTLVKQKKSSKNTRTLKIKKNTGVVVYSPTKRLLDEDFISRAIWECLKNNDPEGVIEIIEAHLDMVNKTHLAQRASLARSTMYHSFKGKNPTVSTLAKLIHACV